MQTKKQSRFKNAGAKLGALATTAMVTGNVMAGELATSLETGVDKAELTAIGVVVLAIAGIILLIRSAKKAGS